MAFRKLDKLSLYILRREFVLVGIVRYSVIEMVHTQPQTATPHYLSLTRDIYLII